MIIKNITESFENIGVRGYCDTNGTVYLNLRDACIGLGFVDRKKREMKVRGVTKYRNITVFIRWNRVIKYLNDLEYITDPIEIRKEGVYIPESVFYRLTMKAKNKTAFKFQKLLAEKVIPSIRRTLIYTNDKNDPIRSMSIQARKLEASSINKLYAYYKATKCPVDKKALYTALSALVNSLARIPNGKRDSASAHQLATIIFAELAIRNIIENGIGEKMPADDIKGAVWDWILQFNEYLNKSDNPDDLTHKLKLKKFNLIKLA